MARNKDMKQMYKEGVKIAEIARRYSISRQRAHQIIKKGYKNTKAEREQAMAKRLEKMLYERFVLGLTYTQIAKRHDITRGRAHQIINAGS